MNRIFIINPFGIGDVLFTTPVISNLRKAYPESFIGYISNRRTLPILENNPKVNRVYVYERDEYHKLYQSNPIAYWRQGLNFFKEIRQQRFDMVIDFSMRTILFIANTYCIQRV